MRKFLIRLLIFSVLSALGGEVIVRQFRLTSDIPRRSIDDSGIQKYKPGQSGHYKRSDFKWRINEYGWPGIASLDHEIVFSLIGDSYLENFMNPISCNQGSVLQSNLADIGFFEAGRSGMTFIEAMETTKLIDSLVEIDKHFLYLNENDFTESVRNFRKHTDRVQVDLDNRSIIFGKMKSPKLRALLYRSKLVYYFYGRLSIGAGKPNLGNQLASNKYRESLSKSTMSDLFEYCSEKYGIKQIVLVLHPGINSEIINTAKSFGFNVLVLETNNDEDEWVFSESNSHWSCYGHEQAAAQVKEYIIRTKK